MTAVALERAAQRKPRTRSEATMCWGELPRHPGRADAWPLCGPWPRPHLAASKLVELRSSVNLVAMPHQPLDRPVASLTTPGLRDVRCAHIAPPWAVLGSPRCGSKGRRQPRVARRSLRSHRSTLGCLGVAALRLPRREPKGRRHQPRVARRSLRSHRSTLLSWGRLPLTAATGTGSARKA
jgi:hypothetical protein